MRKRGRPKKKSNDTLHYKTVGSEESGFQPIKDKTIDDEEGMISEIGADAKNAIAPLELQPLKGEGLKPEDIALHVEHAQPKDEVLDVIADKAAQNMATQFDKAATESIPLKELNAPEREEMRRLEALCQGTNDVKYPSIEQMKRLAELRKRSKVN